MSTITVALHRWGSAWWEWASAAAVQSSVLIGLVLALTWFLGSRLRPAVIQGLWLLVLLKLVLPPSLGFPTGVGYWISRIMPANRPESLARVKVTTGSGQDAWRYGMAAAHRSARSADGSGTLLEPRGWKAALGIVGIVGSFGIWGWVLRGWRRVGREIRESRVAGTAWQAAAAKGAAALGLSRAPEVRVSERVSSPVVCGAANVVILVPAILEARLDSEARQDVVLHEMAHVRRRDLWVSWVEVVLLTVYWWHPLVWLARARLQRSREEIADAVAVSAGHRDATRYAESLLSVAKSVWARPVHVCGAQGILASRGSLRRRIERLLDESAPRSTGLGWRAGLGLLLFGLMAVPMGSVVRQAAAAEPLPRSTNSAASDSNTREEVRNESTKQVDLYGVAPAEGSLAPGNQARRGLFAAGSEVRLTTNLVTRSYKLSMPALVSGLENARGKRMEPGVDAWRDALLETFAAAGIGFEAPQALHLDPRTGRLLVLTDAVVVEKIGRVLDTLMAVPPMILIDSRFVVSSDVRMAFLGALARPDAPALAPTRFREIMKLIDDVIPENDRGPRPRVVTLGGRPAEIEVGIPFREQPEEPAKDIGIWLGSRISVTSAMAEDRTNIVVRLGALQRLPSGESNNAGAAGPVIERTGSAERTVRSGETFVVELTEPTSEPSPLRVDRRGEAAYLLVTVTIVDPAGNPIGVVEEK